MLTRSKIKMEESIRHTQNDLPYFNTDYQPTPTVTYNHSRALNSPSLHSPLSGGQQGRQQALTRNQILKQLRQQYEILRNLSVEDSLNEFGRGYDQERPKLSQSSVSSSVRSKRSDGLRKSEAHHSVKVLPRQLQTLHLEKKQLEIAIGNSMRKIEELLNNEILLKKTIHELKSQNEGKGGINQQYQIKIKTIQKEKDELQEELNSALHQKQKQVQRAKDLTQRVHQLEGDLVSKDRQVKQAFDQHRRLHETIRNQKDKFLNLEIQCKAFKMEIDLLQKQKTSQVNRLLRQFQNKEGSNQKQMAYLIRKLQEEVKEKDRRCNELTIQREQLRRERQKEQTQPVTRLDKNFLELMYKSRDVNDSNSKALYDSMNLIVAKMAELEKKSDETIKREMQALRKKSEDYNKRTSTEVELIARIAQLQKIIDREATEKARLTQEASRLRDQKYELQDKTKELQKKWKTLQEQEIEFREEIQELSQLKNQFHITSTDHKTLKEEASSYVNNIQSLQAEIDGHRQYVSNLNISFKQKEKKYEDEVRVLKRKLDQAQFQTEKAKKQAEFNMAVTRGDHELQAKRIIDQNAKLSQKLKELQETTVLSRSTSESHIKLKEKEISTLKNTLQTLKLKGEKDLLFQKQFYDAKMMVTENRYQAQLRAFNEKFITITTANQKLLSQISILAAKEPEIIELRRLLKQSTTMNAGISHLWEIKEAEYGNINQVLGTLKSV